MQEDDLEKYAALVGDVLCHFRQSEEPVTKLNGFDSAEMAEEKQAQESQNKRFFASKSFATGSEVFEEKAVFPPVPVKKSAIRPAAPIPLKKQEPSSIESLIQRSLPNIRIADQIPSDAHAKTLSSLYKQKAPQVALLFFHAEQLPFLKALARAIHEQLAPAKIWEGNQFSTIESLRLIISTHAGIEGHPHFKESPQPLLFGVPLILLAPVSEYENNAPLKRALWNQLCSLLK